ncbi:lipocalin family protein [Halopseudomonas aestusnigri]|uniref:lipocalin family protein n=1 Tax=Halopseudomonas aestusnigri TaxID=857252 RepID=UPI002557161A|nr:lipocalin family protein [Halopseudomonas aestusnigri]MDL2199014.1 lipocalin family protein [Halopseudomonas aestusnigri]
MKHRIHGLLALTGLALLGGCVQLPDGIEPVTPFQADRYLGHWYEIARLDHRFERGLSQVSAEYSRSDSNEIKVINRGCDAQSGSWNQAEGRARFVDDPNTGFLKVSFFGPFYGTYAIFELDPEYQYAFVSGPNRDYLWFLSRDPEPDAALRQQFVKRAGELGFAVDELIWVKQGDSRCS